MDIPAIAETVLAVIGLASAVATITPTPKDNQVLSILSKLIHLVGMNFGKAKNGSL